jgi:mRNA interferase MazF
MTPVRGEVWLFDLGMVEKIRPGLVISVTFGDADRALLTIVPHTTSLRVRNSKFPSMSVIRP